MTQNPPDIGEAADGKPAVCTVSEANALARGLLEEALPSLWVGGEISNLTIHRSGHVYFSIKDGKAQLAAVHFGGAAKARHLRLREGMEVELFGRLTIYEARGSYQINVNRLRPKGVGALQQQFEELKRRLQQEGLFDPDRKRPLPALPRCVGVVTSSDGAALRDFLNVSRRRFAGIRVRIVPAAVQGANTARDVIAGIRFLNRHRACDVIVVTRGGGSLEDLWGFNDEALARAVAESAIPVVSAVGHEVDFTICDFVADLRAPTPSAAAELVVGQRAELLDRVRQLHRRLGQCLKLRLSRLRNRVMRAAMHPVLREPANLVRVYQQRVDDLYERLRRTLTTRLEQSGRRLERLCAQLRLLDPAQVLRRGYAICIDRRTGAPLTAPSQARVGDAVRAVLAGGELELQVTDLPDQEPHDAG